MSEDHCDRIAKERDRCLWEGAFWRALDYAQQASELESKAKQLSEELTQAWRASSREPTQLESVLGYQNLKAEYSSQVAQRFAIVTDFSAECKSLLQKFQPRLYEFCLAAGGDLEDLKQFYRDIDDLLLSLMPK